jgi:hypothetical protein
VKSGLSNRSALHRTPWPTLVASLAPILLGGWFLYVVVASYTGLPDRPVALPEAGESELLLDDFVVFYAAGKHVPEVGGAVYDPSAISALEADETGQDPGRVSVLPFYNPPSALLLFTPLGLLPLELAAAVWLIASALLALACLLALARRGGWSPDLALLPALGICASLPLYQTLVHGQMTFLLLAGFCLYGAGVIHAGRDRSTIAGLLLLALKPVFLPLPLLYLALRRQYALLAAFAAVELSLVVVAAILFGTRLPLDYLSMSLDALGWDEVNGISTYGMFGWTGLWRGVLGPEARELQVALTALCSIATVAAFAWAFRRGDKPSLALCAMIPASLLISPHSYAQDLLLLVLPLLLQTEGRGSLARVALPLGAWFAAYFHFDTLAATGLGPASIALAVLTGFVLIEAIGARLALREVRPAVRVPASLDTGLSSADAAGS